MRLVPSIFAPSHRPGAICAARLLRSVRRAAAFTIMELMVAIAILIIIILSIAVIFSGASKSVSASTALMETLSNVRGVQQQVDRLVSGMDKNAFLCIRSQMLYTNAPNTPAPNAFTSPRFDQIAFLSYGTFPNPSGAANNLTPFNDSTTANAAHVWIGQLVLENGARPNTSYVLPNEQLALPINSWPTGVVFTPANKFIEADCTLGIHTTILVPGIRDSNGALTIDGRKVVAYPTVVFDPDNPSNNLPLSPLPGDSRMAHITSSRIGVAAIAPSKLITDIRTAGIDYNKLCYRFKALSTIYDTEETNLPFVNGYFRSHPIALRGVSSFKIDWQDAAGNWHNYLNPLGGASGVDRTSATPDTNGNNYIAAFQPDKPGNWPKALRFTYHVVDPNNRLQGGRDFTQVCRLPE